MSQNIKEQLHNVGCCYCNAPGGVKCTSCTAVAAVDYIEELEKQLVHADIVIAELNSGKALQQLMQFNGIR